MSFTVNPYETNGHGPQAEAYWVQYTEEPDEFYQIRPLPNELHQKLLEKHTRPGRNGLPRLNREAFYKALYSHLIAAWEGIYQDDAKTQLLNCTDEAKYALYCASSQRADFIWEEAQRLANSDAARQEAERKSFRHVHPAEAGASTSQLSAVPSVVREG